MSKYGVFPGPYFPVFSPNAGKQTRRKSVFVKLSRVKVTSKSQSAFICSNSSMETPGQCVKSVQSH